MPTPPTRPLSIALVLTIASACYAPSAATAQQTDAGGEASNESTSADFAAPKLSVTQHTSTIAGQPITYTATAGKLPMKTDAGEVKAEMFFVAYTRDGQSAETRPVTFCFNGGPGSSSVWLHLGMVGPRRVRIPDDATTPQPPYNVAPNPHSLLDVTDIVCIDPVSTGYSRPAEGEERGQFHGYEEDLQSVGQFIHDYTTKYRRWPSPKFVLGESYGGIRAAGLSGTLQDRYNMYLNGIIMVSPVVDFSTLVFADNNDLPYVLFLPSYAATAWKHGQLGDDLQSLGLAEVVQRAEEFAYDAYADALLLGASLPDEQRQSVAERYAALTGLSKEYVLRSHLRVPMARFGKELLRDEGKIVGRLDSRFVGFDRDDAGARYGYDPSNTAISGAFAAGMNEYLRAALNYEDERVYEVLTSKVRPWSYDRFENRYATAAETLRQAMTINPHLRVFVACGYYDLATPQYAMRHTVDHLMLNPRYQDHIRTRYYEAGHMMYIHEPSMQKLRKDLLEFYGDATPSPETEE